MSEVVRYIINQEEVGVVMFPVSNSTNVHSIGNTAKGSNPSEDHASLVVKFRRGGTYLYKNVTCKHIQEIHASSIAGSYFSTYIKPTYGFIKIFPAPEKQV